jgi:hypothetical protein
MVNRELQRLVPYHLAMDKTVVLAGTTITVVMQVPGDADFEARYIMASATSVSALLTIRDSGTRLEIMNKPVGLALVTGIGQFPYVLPAPGLFVRNSSIEVVITDYSGQDNTIQIVFGGFLVYPGPIGSM